MASFLPPLPSFSLSSLPPLFLSFSLAPSWYRPPSLLFLSTSFAFMCPYITYGRQKSAEIKGHQQNPVSPKDSPPILINATSQSSNIDMHTHSSLSFCHLAYDQRIFSAAGNMLWLWGGSLLHFWCLSKGWSPAPWPVSALHKHWLSSKHVRTNHFWILLTNWYIRTTILMPCKGLTVSQIAPTSCFSLSHLLSCCLLSSLPLGPVNEHSFAS